MTGLCLMAREPARPQALDKGSEKNENGEQPKKKWKEVQFPMAYSVCRIPDLRDVWVSRKGCAPGEARNERTADAC